MTHVWLLCATTGHHEEYRTWVCSIHASLDGAKTQQIALQSFLIQAREDMHRIQMMDDGEPRWKKYERLAKQIKRKVGDDGDEDTRFWIEKRKVAS